VRNLSALVIGVFCSRTQPPRLSTLFPYTSLFRSGPGRGYQLTLIEAETLEELKLPWERARRNVVTRGALLNPLVGRRFRIGGVRSEEHTSELQSRGHLVCRLLLEKKNPAVNANST